MYFFKNGSGWLYRHDPRPKDPGPVRKSQSPILRKLQAASETTTLCKLVKKLNKENAPPGGW